MRLLLHWLLNAAALWVAAWVLSGLEFNGTLVQLLLPLCADPEAEVAKVRSVSLAETMLARSTAWLRENAGEERYGLYRDLAHVATVEGRLEGEKQEFMYRVADAVDIPRKAADEILYDVLADYLQAQAIRWSPLPHFTSKTRPPPKA